MATHIHSHLQYCPIHPLASPRAARVC